MVKEAREIELPEELTIFTVTEFQEELLKQLKGIELLRIDCGEVSLLDGAGIQLLLSLKKSGLIDKFNIQLTNPTPSFLELMQHAGVGELFELEE